MQTVSELMTRNVQFVSPQESLQHAAQMMDDLNVGALPVCDGDRLVGMITDRDITVRSTSTGRLPQEAHVDEVMSTDVRWCFEDQSIDEVMRQMADTQIRRIPVVSHDDQHKLIGIVALGDLATKASGDDQKQDVEQVVEKISSPSEPDRSSTGNTGNTGGRGAAGGARAHGAATTIAGRGGAGSDTGTATGMAGTDAMAVTGHDAGSTLDADAVANTPHAKNASSTDATRDPTRDTSAPAGTGASGASGGTAGTAGSGGTGVGAKP